MTQLESLEDDFRETVEKLISMLNDATELDWRVVSGRRTFQQQSVLYAQGRTLPGAIVSNALPGNSAHNYGKGADIVPFRDGKPWWEAPRPIWKRLADTAQGLGLVAGYNFKSLYDPAHVEAADWRDDRAAWKSGKRVFA